MSGDGDGDGGGCDRGHGRDDDCGGDYWRISEKKRE